jgi:DNA-binding transcriptional LysR family regulator
MDLRELEYFVAAAEELHFERAAQRVGIDQSPLSRSITLMEERLGVKLFVRTRRSTQLTRVGEALLPAAKRVLAEAADAQRAMVAAAAGRRGRLRVALSAGLGHPRLAELLVQTCEEDPEVDLEIRDRSLRDHVRELLEGRLDVGFALSSAQDAELTSTPLWKDPLVLVLRPNHPLAGQPRINLEDIGPITLFVPGNRPTGRSPIEQLFRNTERETPTLSYVGPTEFLLTLVASRYGLGILTAAQAETIHRRDLIIRPLRTRAVLTTYLLHRTDDTSPLLTRFTARARKHAAPPPAANTTTAGRIPAIARDQGLWRNTARSASRTA